MENVFLIYLAEHPSQGSYLGMTRSGLSNRRSAHFSASRRGSLLPFHKALRNRPCGWKWSILHVTTDEQEAGRLEEQEIAVRPNLLNILAGGKFGKYRSDRTNPRKGTRGKKMSAEFVEWVTEFHKTRPRKRSHDRSEILRLSKEGHTQAQISRLMGCDQGLISRVLSGKFRA